MGRDSYTFIRLLDPCEFQVSISHSTERHFSPVSSLSSAVHSLCSQSDLSGGLVDRLLNCREVKEAPNIVTLHVTSLPYALQTQRTLISPYNEIHWPAPHSSVSAARRPRRHEDPRVLSVGVGWVPALRTFNATQGSR